MPEAAEPAAAPARMEENALRMASSMASGSEACWSVVPPLVAAAVSRSRGLHSVSPSSRADPATTIWVSMLRLFSPSMVPSTPSVFCT